MTMRTEYTSPNGRVKISFDAPGMQALVAGLGNLDEIFSIRDCGKCQSHNIRFSSRTTDKGKYLEYLCGDCGATLQIHCHREPATTVYLKWDDQWENWREKKRSQESHQQSQSYPPSQQQSPNDSPF